MNLTFELLRSIIDKLIGAEGRRLLWDERSGGDS